MLTLRLGLMVWAVAGPLLAGGVVYTAMLAREAIVTAGAVHIARGEETVRCNAQRAALAATRNAATRRSTAEAAVAATEVAPTSAVPAEILALCKASASCRERTAP